MLLVALADLQGCQVTALLWQQVGNLQCSVQHGQVGKFKVLDLLDSVVLEHGELAR